MTKSFRQKLKLPALPKQVFETLLESRRHTRFTGSPAFCSQKEGSEFSAYNGMLTGRNVEILKNKRIVQAWRAKNWPRGVYSIVTFTLTKSPDNKCSLEFSHSGIPVDQFEKIKAGWAEHYWKPLRAYLKETYGAKASSSTTSRKTTTRKTTTARKRKTRRAA